MTEARKRRLAAMAIAVVAWWGLPAAAAAQGCGVHCEPGCCTGDCWIMAPGSPRRGATCGGFQSPAVPTCKMDAPGFATGGGSVACGNPQGKVGWAVVRTQWPSPLEPSGIRVLRASSDDFADYARSLFIPYIQGGMDGTALGTEVLVAAPAGPCEELTFSTPSPLPDLHGMGKWAPVVVYFRATTDGNQRFASFEVLYSEASADEVRRALATGKDQIWISAKRDPSMPIEVYGSLMVVDGVLGFLLEAGSPLFPSSAGTAGLGDPGSRPRYGAEPGSG